MILLTEHNRHDVERGRIMRRDSKRPRPQEPRRRERNRQPDRAANQREDECLANHEPPHRAAAEP
jgi:hypothetical protein